MNVSAPRSADVLFLRAMPKVVKFDAPNRVRELRKAAKLTLGQLGDLIGTTATHVARLEKGERDLGYGWMRAIARALKVSPADLLNDSDGGLSPQERELVDTVREVDERARKAIFSVAESQQPYRGEPEVLPLNPTKRA